MSSSENVSSCTEVVLDENAEEHDRYLRSVLKLKGYLLGPELGKGSFAVVRKIRAIKDNAKYAVKIVDCSKAPDDFLTHFFPSELSIIKKLKHKNVIDTIEIIKVNSLYLIPLWIFLFVGDFVGLFGCGFLLTT